MIVSIPDLCTLSFFYNEIVTFYVYFACAGKRLPTFGIARHIFLKYFSTFTFRKVALPLHFIRSNGIASMMT